MESRRNKKEGFGAGAVWLTLGFGAVAIVAGYAWLNAGNSESAADQAAAETANVEALNLVKMGKLADAETKLEPFVQKKGSGAISCMQTLATIYALDSKVADVERVCASLGGNTESGTADKLHFLGAPMAISKPKFAKPLLERSAQIYKKLYGEDSKQYSKDLYNIGVCDAGMQQYTLAAQEFTRAIPLLEKAYGADDQITKAAKYNLMSSRQGEATPGAQTEMINRLPK